jgi:hypothetical protein
MVVVMIIAGVHHRHHRPDGRRHLHEAGPAAVLGRRTLLRAIPHALPVAATAIDAWLADPIHLLARLVGTPAPRTRCRNRGTCWFISSRAPAPYCPPGRGSGELRSVQRLAIHVLLADAPGQLLLGAAVRVERAPASPRPLQASLLYWGNVVAVLIACAIRTPLQFTVLWFRCCCCVHVDVVVAIDVDVDLVAAPPQLPPHSALVTPCRCPGDARGHDAAKPQPGG